MCSFERLQIQRSEQGSVEVIGPDGRRPLSLSEARTAQTLRFEHAGFYQIRLANGRDMLIGVNPDRRESDLQPIAEDVQTTVERELRQQCAADRSRLRTMKNTIVQ